MILPHSAHIIICRYIFGQGSVHQIASDVAKSKGIEAAIITLPDGTTASWLGSENAKHVIVYFYGKKMFEVQYSPTDCSEQVEGTC